MGDGAQHRAELIVSVVGKFELRYPKLSIFSEGKILRSKHEIIHDGCISFMHSDDEILIRPGKLQLSYMPSSVTTAVKRSICY